MRIKTKYNLGDIVRFYSNQDYKFHIGEIKSIQIIERYVPDSVTKIREHTEEYRITTKILGNENGETFFGVKLLDIRVRLNSKEIRKEFIRQLVKNEIKEKGE